MTRSLAVLLPASVMVIFITLCFGDYPVSVTDVISALRGTTIDPQVSMIVMDIRLPRVLLAFLVGVALGVGGAVAQAVMRNPLAEPGLIGINSGAAAAAIFAIVGLGIPNGHAVSLASFAGAAVMTLAIWSLSWHNGTSSLRIILIGIGLSSLGMAATTMLTAFGDIRDVQRAMVWLAGSVQGADWRTVSLLALWLPLPLLAVILFARELDTLGFDDDTARSVGQRVDLVRGLMILACTLLSAAAVAAAGLIGFIGLVAPHMARRLVGSGNSRCIPVAALLGGLLVLAADQIGGMLFPPARLPAGLVTALIGAPLFALLLWKRRHGTT